MKNFWLQAASNPVINGIERDQHWIKCSVVRVSAVGLNICKKTANITDISDMCIIDYGMEIIKLKSIIKMICVAQTKQRSEGQCCCGKEDFLQIHCVDL